MMDPMRTMIDATVFYSSLVESIFGVVVERDGRHGKIILVDDKL